VLLELEQDVRPAPASLTSWAPHRVPEMPAADELPEGSLDDGSGAGGAALSAGDAQPVAEDLAEGAREGAGHGRRARFARLLHRVRQVFALANAAGTGTEEGCPRK
jgi:hypothetical protein